MTHPKRFTYLVRARIKWFGRAANPDKPLPTSFISMPARFFGSLDEWPHTIWDLVVELNQPWDTEKTTLANVGFSSPDAPRELLTPGNMFGLWDGEIVAEGEVLSYLR